MQVNIIDRLRNQDPHAQEHFYKTQGARFFRICYRYLGNESDAAEVLNDGFYKVFTAIHSFKDGGFTCLVAWAAKIMVNECLQHIRKYKKIAFVNEVEAVIDEELNTSYIESDAEFYYGLIRQLDFNYRTVFNLFVIEGFTHKEIADLLDIPENTSRSHLLRARLELQKNIEKLRYHER